MRGAYIYDVMCMHSILQSICPKEENLSDLISFCLQSLYYTFKEIRDSSSLAEDLLQTADASRLDRVVTNTEDAFEQTVVEVCQLNMKTSCSMSVHMCHYRSG